MSVNAQDLGGYATAATALVAFVALIVALRQLSVGRRETRLSTARTIYREYLAMAVAHPEFSSASYPLASPDFNHIKCNKRLYEQYEFYVSHLMFAAETILELSGNDTHWRATLRDQLGYHAIYLDGPDLLSDHYDSKLNLLTKEAIVEYNSRVQASKECKH